MKTYFSEVVKYFLKSEKVMVQRIEEFYFVCNNFAALKIPESIYKSDFSIASGLFSPLESGEGLTIDPEYGESNKTVRPFDISSLFKMNVEKHLETLPLLVELPKQQSKRSKKKHNLQPSGSCTAPSM